MDKARACPAALPVVPLQVCVPPDEASLMFAEGPAAETPGASRGHRRGFSYCEGAALTPAKARRTSSETHPFRQTSARSARQSCATGV